MSMLVKYSASIAPDYKFDANKRKKLGILLVISVLKQVGEYDSVAHPEI